MRHRSSICPKPAVGNRSDAECKTAARIERHRLASKENNLFVTGASGITAHNQVTVGVKVEYSRQLKGNFIGAWIFGPVASGEFDELRLERPRI